MDVDPRSLSGSSFRRFRESLLRLGTPLRSGLLRYRRLDDDARRLDDGDRRLERRLRDDRRLGDDARRDEGIWLGVVFLSRPPKKNHTRRRWRGAAAS